MKTKLRYFLLFLTAIVGVTYFYLQGEIEIKQSTATIVEQRKQHQQYLDNSPFKKTLQLSKAERKAEGLPPNKYYEREWELTMNPATGKPEPNKIFEIQKQRNSLKGRAPGDGAVGNDWIDRGPNNVGGRTRVVLFDPNDATNKRVYAGGVSGGLWVNNDITTPGSTWTLVSGVPSNMNISCITVDPNNSSTWYIGTGEQYTFGAAVGNGVYKSIDGGANWVNIPVQVAGVGNLASTTSNFLAGIYYINDIIAWDNGGNTEIYLGVGGHYYGDAANPNNILGLQSSGLYKSTDDGTNWSRIEPINMNFQWSGFDFYYIPNDFEISADNTLWFGTITTPAIGGGGGGRLFKTTDGATWTEAGASPLASSNRVELAVSATDATVMYVLTEGTTTAGPHIYATSNTFSSVIELAKPSDADLGISSGDFTRGQSFYDLVIEVDPTDDAIIYVGGIDLFRSNQGAGTNLASEWKQISKWSNNSNLNTLSCSLVHADQHAFAFRPGSSNEAVIGCDGGVYYASSLSTADTNDVFTEMNDNLNITQFYFGGYGQDTTNELILAGAQDNGSQFIEGAAAGANSSVEVYGGDGAYSTIDKDGNYMIASYVYSNHTYIDLPYANTGYEIDSNYDEGDFITPAGLDHNLNIMYSNGTNGTDQINRYTLGSASATKEQLTNVLLDGSPSAFKVSPFTVATTTLFVGTDNGKLLKLTNADGNTANITWKEITGPSFVGSISAVELGENEDEIFVTFHNYGVTSVWYTSTGGATWKNKEGNLPDMPVKSILQNPLARNEVIVGTELGIYTSKNFNEDTPIWTSSFSGMQDVKVVDLDLRTADNSILATTFGRGTFTGQFTSSTDPTFTITTSNSLVNECKPDDVVFNFDFTALGGYSSTTTFSATGEPAGSVVSFSVPSLSATGTFTMTISNLSGVVSGEYIMTVTGTAGTKVISTEVILKVNEATLGVVNTVSPADGATGIAQKNNIFSWDALLGATSYDIEISSDAGFGTIIEAGTTENNSYTSSVLLDLSTVYYWRVKGVNYCAVGEFSPTKAFQTAPLNSCNTFSNAAAVPIPDGGGANIAGAPATSTINIATAISISDVNVTIDISHTYIQDLVISLIGPDATEVILFNRECAGENNIVVTYDDEASAGFDCANNAASLIVIPTNALSAYNGKSSVGDWTLKVVDYYNGDTGTINSWSIDTCEPQAVTNSAFTNNIITVGTDSTYTLKQTDIDASSAGSIASETVYMLTKPSIVGELQILLTKFPRPLVLGDTFTQDDINTGKVTYVNSSTVTVSDSFLVDITNATGGFLHDQQIMVNIDAALGIDDDFFRKTGISVYPTISDGNFSISSTRGIGKTTVELYSITGQKVFVEQLDFNSGTIKNIQTGSLASGVYILWLSAEDIQGSKKIIIK